MASVIAEALRGLGLSVLPWWDEHAFRPGDVTLTRLVQIAKLCEASVLVFGGEDEVWFRGRQHMAARDNVLMEYGLFVGQTGLQRAIIVAKEGIKLPSNVDGVTAIFFRERESYISVAGRVRAHFQKLLANRMRRESLSDSGIVIHTDWNLAIHRVDGNGFTGWSGSSIYEGRDGALAWSKVEEDPRYADRTQRSINGGRIAELVGAREISTIVSLGPGMGAIDAEVASNLKSTRLREYVPVDINRHFLLNSAKRVAAQNPTVECKSAIQCDFDTDTSFIGSVILDQCPGPRLFLMAGGTFGNSTRSVSALLSSLFAIMEAGDTFTFDLFCHGPGYDPQQDALHRPNWSSSVEAFFVNGLRRLAREPRMPAAAAKRRLDTVIAGEGRSALPRTITISVTDKETGQTIIDIRRFDLSSIKRAISMAGFSIGSTNNAPVGQLQRHILLAMKK
jgi:hypothetical protein